MSDETKAGIVALSWLTVFAVFVADPSPIRALLLIFTTVIELLFCKHDVEKEALRKSRQRYADHADFAIRKTSDSETEPEEKYRRIIGEWK